MSSALATTADDDDDGGVLGLEEPVDKIKDAELAKKRILALRNDAERKTDYQSRLKRKLHKLDQALAEQREQVESLQRTLLLEQMRDEADDKSRQIEAKQKKEAQEEKIRNQLQEVLYAKLPGQGNKKNYQLDTVLISFIRPNDNIRYKLPFRVDKDTTLKHLLDDACKYWDVSTEDFILKTMANSKCQNEILVQDCFKQGEIAQLRLESKNKEQTDVTEAEEKAIWPKSAKTRKRDIGNKNYSDLGANLTMQHNDKYFAQLKQLGGVYFLLRLRDPKPSEHWSKIKLRDCIFYTLLAFVTFMTYYYQRLPGESFWFLDGIQSAFTDRHPNPSLDPSGLDYQDHVPSFNDVQTYSQVWDWLQITLPKVVYGGSNDETYGRSLSSYNMLVGYMSIRVKNVKSTDKDLDWHNRKNLCPSQSQNMIEHVQDGQCTPIMVEPDTEETQDLIPLDRYWEQSMRTSPRSDTDTIRGPARPYKHISAEDNLKKHQQRSTAGSVQFYDAAGYALEYKIDVPRAVVPTNLEFYNSDMAELRRLNWININTTRAVIIGMNMYNYNYDKWASLELLFEMPISGQVLPKLILREFAPYLTETRSEIYILYFYFGRCLMAVYIFIGVGSTEIRHKTKNQKAGYIYYASFNGICDLGICITCVGAVMWRYLRFRDEKPEHLLKRLADPGKTLGYQSFNQQAWEYESLFIVEGFLLMFTMLRLLSLLRLNRTVYLMWRMIGEAVQGCGYFSVVFLATYWGFIVVGLKIWGESIDSFKNLSEACLSVFQLGKGNLNFEPMIKHDTMLSVVYYTFFYVFVTFMLMAGFTTIFIEAYYTVMLTTTAIDSTWDAQKWKAWFIHPVVLSLWQYATQGGDAQSSG